MLPESLRLLIVAYAAGDLSPRQCRSAARLLKHSGEAQELFQRLRDDADGLRRLERRCLTPEFRADLLRRLPAKAAQPAEVAKWPVVQRWFAPVWARHAAAAAIVLAVAVGSYGLRTATDQRERRPADIVEHASSSAANDHAETPVVNTDVVAVVPPTVELPRADRVATQTKSEHPPVPPADSLPAEVLTAVPNTNLRLVEVTGDRYSVVLQLRGLGDAETSERLRRELGKGETHRIDLHCREPHRALERLTLALRPFGVKVFVDGTVADAVKRKIRQPYVFYTDEFSASEYTTLLRALGTGDRRAAERRPEDAVFEQVVVSPLSASDQKELALAIGIDVLQPEKRAAQPNGLDVRKPLAEGTADHVAKALETGAKPGTAPAPKRSAVYVPFGPVRSGGTTGKEVRQFIDAHKPRQPGRIAVLLVIHPTA